MSAPRGDGHDDVLLDAGAILPAGTAISAADSVDPLQARRYLHPALDARPVVRLVPRTLAEAEDLTMDYLGFAAPERTATVGDVRRNTLGFPAWALVHDPDNAHHALALVKEIEHWARRAKVQIGPAKDGLTALGDRLARSVPHFLPTYYEEAARIFLRADSPTYAAMMFGKAREAEESYALEVDEERQHAAFLEFVLAGALTAKALSAHARRLARRCEPVVAFERFLRLCRERTFGGVLPYAGMVADLRRLAKAAGMRAGDADERVIRQLLPAPVLAAASEEFWSGYRPALARLAAGEPEILRLLLTTMPTACPAPVWLELLLDAGAAQVLTAPAGQPHAAEPADGPAGWLTRFATTCTGKQPLPALLELIPRMAPRLIADGVPVVPYRRYRADAELVDVCLSHGVPVADPAGSVTFALKLYFRGETRSALTAVAADPRFIDALVSAVSDLLPVPASAERMRQILAVAGLRTAVAKRLRDIADDVGGAAGLPELGAPLWRARELALPEAAAVEPEAVARLTAVELAGLLRRTLRGGLFDEFGWPALEGAVRQLTGGDRGKEVEFVEQWPALVVHRGMRFVVVDGERVLLDHTVMLPRGTYVWDQVPRYVDGQLLVTWEDGDWFGQWSGSGRTFPIADGRALSEEYAPWSVQLAGGGRSAGGRPLRLGDHEEDARGRVFTDGTGYWLLPDGEEPPRLYEFDPDTGERGPASRPEFLATAGAEVLLPASWLRTAPPDAVAAPVATAGGQLLFGWRVTAEPDGTLLGESASGRRFRWRVAAGRRERFVPVGVLRFPGTERDGGVSAYGDSSRGWLTLWSPDGLNLGEVRAGATRSPYAAGTPLVPPAAYWHHLRPRDPAGSRALREVTLEQATRLLEGATGMDAEHVPALVREVIGGLTAPELVAGVAGVVAVAAKLAGTRQELISGFTGAQRAGSAAPQPVVGAAAGAAVEDPWAGDPTESQLQMALGSLMPYVHGRGAALIRAVGATLTATASTATASTGTGAVPELPEEPIDAGWFSVFRALPALMYRAASPWSLPEDRRTIARLLRGCQESGLLAAGSRLRLVRLAPVETGVEPATTPTVGTVQVVAGQRLLMVRSGRDGFGGRSQTMLQFAPDGQFVAVPGHAVVEEQLLTDGTVDAERVAAFLELLTERGPMPWRAELPATCAAATGLSVAESLLLLTGFAHGVADGASQPGAEDRPAVELPAAWLPVARNSWQVLTKWEHLTTAHVVSLLFPAELEELWERGPRLDRLADWCAGLGRRVSVPDDLIVAVERADVVRSGGASQLLHGIANPERWPLLTTTGLGTGDAPLTSSGLRSVLGTIQWLAYHLPADDPLRATLPGAAQRLRALFRDPDFSLNVTTGRFGETIEALLDAVGARPRDPAGGATAAFVVEPEASGWSKLWLHPALLSGAGDPALELLAATLEYEADLIAAVRQVLGGDVERFVAGSVLPGGVTSHDPSRAVPDLVAEVAGKASLSPDAATLYLQLLALPDPTDRNVARWTGWRPARLKAARAELAATPLVVSAKRARAGRSLFLPGGWLAFKAPLLPVEPWKVPLLTVDEAGATTFGVVVPVAPLAEAYHLAWRRIQDGDAPGFDELVT